MLVATITSSSGRAENNTTNIITASTNAGSLYVVGNSGALNYLEVRGPGGLLTATNNIIGLEATAGTNSATVTGPGARWISLNAFYIGLTGSVSRLVVSNAGVITNDTAYIGNDQNSRNNSALITGANSRWRAESLLVVGEAGSDNSLTVSNGGVISSGFDSFISGGNSSATNNSGIVTGAGSQWNTENCLYVGYGGAGNRFVISSGGVVSNGLGVVGSFASSNNVVTVTGANSAWKMPQGDLTIGDSQSTSNQLIVSNGGLISSLTAVLGNADVAGENTVTVTGGGSQWLVKDSLSVGDVGGRNQLVIEAGGIATNLDAVVGAELSGSSNSVTVTGSGSSWTNRNLTVGDEGSGNSVTVQNGGVIRARTNYIGFALTASNNSVSINGSGSRLVTAQDCYVGYGGSDGRLSVSGGAQATHYSTWVGTTVDSANNTLWLADSGTVLSNASALEIAFDGTGNSLVITNGAKALSSFGRVSTYGYLTRALVTGTNSSWSNSGELYIGQVGAHTQLNIENGGTISNFNGYAGVYNLDTFVTVTGPGSRWINGGDLFVNYGGIQHQLIISNGGLVTDVNGYVGVSEASTVSTVQVSGPGSTWVNARNLYLGFSGLDNTLSIADGGTVRATNLVAGLSGQSSNSLISVSAGNLIVTNSGNTARIDMQRGTLALTNGSVRTGYLLLGTNAALAGTGTNIATWITNSGAIAPGTPAGRLNLHAGLALRSSSILRFELGGYNQGITYDFLSVSNAAVLNGTLAVSFINGFQNTMTNNSTFTLMSAASLAGAFANATNGGRLVTTDGFADFVVSYTGGNLVLSQARLLPRLVPQLRITSITGAGTASVTLNYTNALAGTNYTLQYNTDLNTTNWVSVSTKVAPGTGDSQTDIPAAGAVRFYRVALASAVPPPVPPRVRLTGITRAGTSSITVHYTNTLAGTNYTLQINTNLGATNWVTAGLKAAIGTSDFQTDNSAISGTRYYRVLYVTP